MTSSLFYFAKIALDFWFSQVHLSFVLDKSLFHSSTHPSPLAYTVSPCPPIGCQLER